MAKHISRIEIKNFVGIHSFAFQPGKVNFIKGENGVGKTSVIEALAATLKNDRRRHEVISHGEHEATLFVELSDGLSIDRRIRDDKGDYLKLRMPGQAVPSSEGFLRQFVNGEIFRPLYFIEKKPDEQRKIILSMLVIPWTHDDIQQWFGYLPAVSYSDFHILQILHQIEADNFDERETVNRETKVLEAQAAGYKAAFPQNYDGETWRATNVRELDAKVAQAQETNRRIDTAKALIEGLDTRIKEIRENTETTKAAKVADFKTQRAEGREYIGFIRSKIEPYQQTITMAPERLSARKAELDAEMERKIQAIRDEYAGYYAQVDKTTLEEADAAKFEIARLERTITAKETEITGLDTLETAALVALDQQEAEKIKTAEATAGNAKLLAGQEITDIAPLQTEADNVQHMQSFLRDWDRMQEIIRREIEPRKQKAAVLTARIETARRLPQQLIKLAKVNIPGLSVDPEGDIRVNGTLIDGLSEGQQFDLAVAIAEAQAGDLKVICWDGIDKLTPANRARVEAKMATDEYQHFVTTTDQDGPLTVEIKEGVN